MKRPFVRLLFLFLSASFATADEPGWTRHVIQDDAGTLGMVNTAVTHDLDADGDLDVIASFDAKVVAYRQDQRVEAGVASMVWHAVAIDDPKPLREGQRRTRGCIHSCLLDVDGDGDMDFCGSNQTVFWLENPAMSTNSAAAWNTPWTYRTIDDEIRGTHCLITGDVNQDGKIDLIANSFQVAEKTSVPESITWLETPADPTVDRPWTRHVFADRDAPGGNHYMGFGDVNGDGRPDIACGAKGGKSFAGGEWFAWWEQPTDDPTGPWKKHLISATQPGATNILPRDLDGDGTIDYAFSRGHGAGVGWFRGPDFETETIIDADMQRPHCLDAVDLDADGDIDLITCGAEKTGVAAWYENDGEAAFTKHLIAPEQSSYDIRTADIDGDGDLDVLIAGHHHGNVLWFEQP